MIDNRLFLEETLKTKDVRNSSNVEVRMIKESRYLSIYQMVLKGRIVETSVRLEGSWIGIDLITQFCGYFADPAEELQLLSRKPKARSARDMKEFIPTPSMEAEFMDYQPDAPRYDNHVVSEILPNYKITVKDLTEE